MPSSREQPLAGRYRLLEALGRGGMGVVWRARDEYLQRDVAVKEILLLDRLDDATRTGLLERFVREARAAARLDHPAIISVYDVVAEHDLPWIVMQLIRGRSLDQMVREHGPLSPDAAATIGLQVLDALDTAHAEGILHRDVTPRNVLVGDDGRVVLTDFGIASMDGATALTQTGALIGSPGYIAPERLRGRPAGPASDLWSLGAVLYFAVEGRPAYSADEIPAMIGMVLTEQPAPPTRAGPLAPVLEGLLVKDPAARPDADSARRRLRAVTETSGGGTGPGLGALTTLSPVSQRQDTTDEPARNAHRPPPVPGGPPPYGPYQDAARLPTPPPPAFGPGTRPARSNGSRKAATIALVCGLVVVLTAAGIVVNVAWNPFGVIGEGRFSSAPACGGVTRSVLDQVIPQPRHAAGDHCEWWSLRNPNLDFKVLSTTRYARSWWHSADDRAHSALNKVRDDPGQTELPVGDENSVTQDSGELTNGSGTTLVWFRVSNVVVKMSLTSPKGSSVAHFAVIGAARGTVSALASHH